MRVYVERTAYKMYGSINTALGNGVPSLYLKLHERMNLEILTWSMNQGLHTLTKECRASGSL